MNNVKVITTPEVRKIFRTGMLAGIGIAAATMFFALWLAQFIYV
jgi:hypothetical protein